MASVACHSIIVTHQVTIHSEVLPIFSFARADDPGNGIDIGLGVH